MTYTQRSATGQGWEDAKAGKENNNPYLPSSFRWLRYEWGYWASTVASFSRKG